MTRNIGRTTKLFGRVVLILLLSMCTSCTYSDHIDFDKAESQVLLIVRLLAPTGGVCSGFLKEKVVITARHCLNNYEGLPHITHLELNIKPEKKGWFKKKDIGFLRVRIIALHSNLGLLLANICTHIHIPGDKVYTIGHYDGHTTPTKLFGTIEDLYGNKIETNIHGYFGLSGSPLFCHHGNIIGVTSTMNISTTHITAVRLTREDFKWIQKALASQK